MQNGGISWKLEHVRCHHIRWHIHKWASEPPCTSGIGSLPEFLVHRKPHINRGLSMKQHERYPDDMAQLVITVTLNSGHKKLADSSVWLVITAEFLWSHVRDNVQECFLLWNRSITNTRRDAVVYRWMMVIKFLNFFLQICWWLALCLRLGAARVLMRGIG